MNDSLSIMHLYRRAGFGLSPQEWKRLRKKRLSEAIDDLFAQTQVQGRLKSRKEALNEAMSSVEMVENEANLPKSKKQNLILTNAAWIRRMASPEESALVERMSLFWHGHFACATAFSLLAIQQLNVFREHGLGNFRELLIAIARDPAMVRYLNNQQNRKLSPNENFARELMELFTIGRGNYSENDIKEAARAFTGWSSKKEGDFVFRSRHHDYGMKSFMGKSGKFDGTDIIDIILEQPETATFICRKIYRYFVNEKIDETKVAELAAGFRKDYNIGRLMRTIFSSDWFYAAENVGNKIKSPVELIAGLMRQLNVSAIASQGIIGLQQALGQMLLRPPNVAGWPGGNYWIDNSTLLLRLNLAAVVFQASDFDFELAPELEQENKRRLKKLGAVMDLKPLEELVRSHPEELPLFLLATPPPPSMKNYPSPMVSALQLMSTPEYQLC